TALGAGVEVSRRRGAARGRGPARRAPGRGAADLAPGRHRRLAAFRGVLERRRAAPEAHGLPHPGAVNADDLPLDGRRTTRSGFEVASSYRKKPQATRSVRDVEVIPSLTLRVGMARALPRFCSACSSLAPKAIQQQPSQMRVASGNNTHKSCPPCRRIADIAMWQPDPSPPIDAAAANPEE